MVISRDEAISTISKVLNDFADPELCILYGSGASDRLTSKSDLDLAVASEKGLTSDFRLRLSNRLSEACGREVSVLDLSHLEGLILKEILCKGIQLRNKNSNMLASFTIKMLDYVEDLLPYQMIGIKANLRRSFGE